MERLRAGVVTRATRDQAQTQLGYERRRTADPGGRGSGRCGWRGMERLRAGVVTRAGAGTERLRAGVVTRAGSG